MRSRSSWTSPGQALAQQADASVGGEADGLHTCILSEGPQIVGGQRQEILGPIRERDDLDHVVRKARGRQLWKRCVRSPDQPGSEGARGVLTLTAECLRGDRLQDGGEEIGAERVDPFQQ